MKIEKKIIKILGPLLIDAWFTEVPTDAQNAL